MNNVYTKVNDKAHQSTDWIHFFYLDRIKWEGITHLSKISGRYWEETRKKAYRNKIEIPSKKAYALYCGE